VATRDVVFAILAIDKASATLERIGLAAETSGGKFGKFGKLASDVFAGVTLGAAAAAFEGVRMGATFESSMEQLHTQAGVSQKATDELGQSVLQLAGKVGTNPDSLADALYHVESSFASTGISGQEAMHLLETSAKGAKVGHANLTDVTNALDAAVVSGIPGVKDFDQAMGALNATVGSGDMRMQDLADAFGTGVLASVKTYGLTLRDVGASLAVFGDNNIRGAEAGTQLRMTVQSMTTPAKTGAAALKELGLNTDTLAKAMQHGGLQEGMKVLVEHLHKAGIKGDETGQILTQAFGKKAGVGINILVDQYDRLKSKYPEIDKASKEFASSWEAQQKTFAQQWDQLKATIDALLIRLGLKLIPMIKEVIDWMKQHKTAVEAIGIAAGVFVGILFTVGLYLKIAQAVQVAMKLWTAAQWLLNAALDANPIGIIVLAVAALVAGIIYLWQNNETFRRIVLESWGAVKDFVSEAVRKIVEVWNDLWSAGEKVVKWFEDLPGLIWDGVKKIPGLIKEAIEGAFYIFGYNLGLMVKEAINFPGQIMWAVEKLPGLMEALFRLWWDASVAVFWAMWNSLIAILKWVWDVIVETVKVGIQLTIWWFTQMPGEVYNIVKQIPDLIINVFKSAGSWLWGAGKAIVGGLVQGIKDEFWAGVNIVKDLGGQMISGFADAVGWHSPAAKFIPGGRSIPQGVQVGIDQGTPELQATIAGMTPTTLGGGSVVPIQRGPGQGGGGITLIVNVTNAVVGNKDDLIRTVADALREGVRRGSIPASLLSIA